MIETFESFSATPYVCPAGYPTIGYGHVIRPGEVFDAPITVERAEEMLSVDLQSAERSVLRLVRVPLEDCQFDALVDFTFNLGAGALQRSTLRSLLNRGEYRSAADEFLKWIHAGARVLRGLVRRRVYERAMFLEAL